MLTLIAGRGWMFWRKPADAKRATRNRGQNGDRAKKAASWQRELLAALRTVSPGGEKPAAPDKEVPTGGEQTADTLGKGHAPRDAWFVKQYEANGTDTYHKPAKIHAKWNSMTAQERAEICSDSRNKITKAAVAKAINRALLKRDGPKSAESKQKPQKEA